jgi:flagellar hook-associated protein 1 FlgK
MTYQALTTAISGLRAAQAQLSVISNNVTNATTPGYNRQILPQSTQVLRESGQTVGVLTESAVRVVDMNLQRDLWTQVSASSMQSVQLNYLQQVQNFNGPPDKEFSVAAKIAELRDSFSALSDIPDDTQALEATVGQAQVVADKFNDYAELITTLRNDTQGDLQSSVNNVNNLLREINGINTQIRGAENFGNSVAGLEDQRDLAIKSLTEEIDITFFERSDGVLVVQTREGHELVGDVAQQLEFDADPISAQQYYPDTASGLLLVSTANNNRTVIDITDRVVGGRVGGLLEMRDEVLPSYHAQLDELAYQMASRFDAQGLTLFTDQTGNLPLNTAPDPTTFPDPTPVPYVDFARTMQVNSNIVDNPLLLQTGTYNADAPSPTGDNEVIRRVLEFTFGDVAYQEAVGTTDIVNVTGGVDLQSWLGLSSKNQVVVGTDLSNYTEIDDGDPLTVDETEVIDTLQELFPGYPNNDQFTVTFEEPRAGSGTFGPATITVDLSEAANNFPIGGGINNALDQIVAEIGAQITAAGLTSDQASVQTNVYGQIVFESTGNIAISGSGFPDAMGEDAMGALGIQEGFFETEDPSFTVQVGNEQPYVITLEPGDGAIELEAKLTYNPATQTGIPGLFVDIDAATGTLTLRPGIDDSNFGPLDTNPSFGGDITITAGAFETNLGAGSNPALVNNINIVSAIFGSFDPVSLNNNSPINNVGYNSEILSGSNNFTSFRNDYLGPNAAISTGIFSSSNLLDYAQKVIDETSQDYLQAQSAFENEDTLRGILQREFSDESGVNIDEEMSNLIVVQTAYAAAARTITAADEMFQELINSIR